MLNKTILTIVMTALAFTCLNAQDNKVLDKVSANPALARGHYYINPNAPSPQTKAPKGYKAFYISHFARHGARYCWEDIYTRMDTLLTKAHEAGKLTEKGEALLAAFHPWAKELSWHTGELTRKGWEQHATAARNIVKAYPEVFSKGSEVSATSSDSDRCEMSMASYCLELSRQRPTLPIYEYVSVVDYDAVLPTSKKRPDHFESPTAPNPFGTAMPAMKDTASDIVAAYFDLDWVKENSNVFKMSDDLYTLWCCTQCADEPVNIEKPISDEQEIENWKNSCFFSFLGYNRKKYESWPVAADIVDKADRRIASGKPGADLRFSHDSYFGPLYVLLDIDGGGTPAASPELQYENFQTYDICMATNLHFVFYRSKKNPEILFKLLLNGVETTLPLNPVEGPYYRWNDFKALVDSLDPRRIQE